MKTNFYLRLSDDGESGTVMISLCKNRRTVYFSTDIRIPAECWDSRTKSIVGSRDAKSLNSLLSSKQIMIEKVIDSLEFAGKTRLASASEIKTMVDDILNPRVKESELFITVYRNFQKLHKAESSRKVFEVALNAMKKFDPAVTQMTLDGMKKSWFQAFYGWCVSAGLRPNTMISYFGCIKGTFSYAMDHDLTTNYPLRTIRIEKDSTRKRSLSPEQFKAFLSCDLSRRLQRYRDLFLLSFSLIGMNPKDILFMTKPSGDRLNYVRMKTGRAFSVLIQPEAREIMDRYRGKEHYLSFLDGGRDFLNFESLTAKSLRTIGEKIDVPGLTMYWARHTWATMAAELEIPKETISAALGHSTNVVTDVYIKFDQKKIDEANRKVLDFALYGKRPLTVAEMITKSLNEFQEKMKKAGSM